MSIQIHAAGIIIENNKGEILLLLKNKERPEGRTWGPPGGRIENNESPQKAAVREAEEEINLEIKLKDLHFNNTLKWGVNWKETKYTITYESFLLKLPNPFKITLDENEHTDYMWIKPQDAYERKDLMKGTYVIIENLYGSPQNSKQ